MSIPVLLLEKSLLLSSLLGGVATQLPLGLGLHGALGSADGGGTGDGGFTEIGAVAGLGGGGGNVLEGPVQVEVLLAWGSSRCWVLGGMAPGRRRFVDVLAVVGAEGALVGVLCGLAAGLGLGDDVDALVTLGRDTDGLLVDVSGVLWANWSASIIRRVSAHYFPRAPLGSASGGSYLAGVHVGQVEGVAGELDTASCVALDQVGVVVAYYDTMLGAAFEWWPCMSISPCHSGSVTRTGDLPDEIGGDVRKRHLDGDVLKIGGVVGGNGRQRAVG